MKLKPICLGTVCLTFFILHASSATLYVDLNSTSPVSPYTNWVTAATNIQDAVSRSQSGDTILVTNGVYQYGTYSASGLNRVYILPNLTVKSVNGPAVTTIMGYQVPGTINGSTAVRCVYLNNGAILSGFTLTNGATQTVGYSGGGVYCQSTSALVTNCIIIGNAADNTGGGTCSGTIINCTLKSNAVSLLSYGSAGGAYSSVLVNCILAGNRAGYEGGGAYLCSLTNCLVYGNSGSDGGGAASSTLVNCTVVSNSVYYGGYGGGTFGGTLINCIVYYNQSGLPGFTNYFGGTFTNCCTTPLPGGASNIASAPVFVDLADGNFRLQTNSPCINAGNNSFITNSTDLDGRPRIVGGTVDMGAYEFQGAGMGEFIGWLQQYGLPTGGPADFVDSDGDGMNNWQEWIAGTNPTNAASVLTLSTPVVSKSLKSVKVTWQSVTGKNYFLQRSTNLFSPLGFLTIQSNLTGQAGTTSFTDITATNGNSFFYRVGVQ
jgi:hypothetical protein